MGLWWDYQEYKWGQRTKNLLPWLILVAFYFVSNLISSILNVLAYDLLFAIIATILTAISSAVVAQIAFKLSQKLGTSEYGLRYKVMGIFSSVIGIIFSIGTITSIYGNVELIPDIITNPQILLTWVVSLFNAAFIYGVTLLFFYNRIYKKNKGNPKQPINQKHNTTKPSESEITQQSTFNNIETELTAFADMSGYDIDDIVTQLRITCPFDIPLNKLKAFAGVLITHTEVGSEKAIEAYDKLIKHWINTNANSTHIEVITTQAFFTGALYSYGVISKEESDKLSQKYAAEILELDIENNQQETGPHQLAISDIKKMLSGSK